MENRRTFSNRLLRIANRERVMQKRVKATKKVEFLRK